MPKEHTHVHKSRHRTFRKKDERSYVWQKPWKNHESLEFIKGLAFAHAKQGGKQGECIASCIASGDLLSLCNYDLSYEAAESIEELRHCRQALGFITKLDFIELGVDRRLAAKESWLRAEADCGLVNECFRKAADGDFCFLPHVSSVLHRLQRKIAAVLGKAPTFAELRYRFGPGATTLTKKRIASSVEKLQAGISCSEDLLPYASRILEEMPHLAELHSKRSDNAVWAVDIQVDDEHVRFVPKTAKTDRSISVNPSLNTMVQLALGDIMSRSLAAVGVDLKDQSLNQRLAQQGSIDGSFATIDLTSASDTVAYELCAHLLPWDWFVALSSCRCSFAVLDGQRVLLEKFSSQGNGFTFPLETLIFWAISSTASDDDFVSVYGDDIIVKGAHFDATMASLRSLGFTPNSKKSFGTGWFRESCGADFYKGINIRPYYQKELLSWAEVFKIHNHYVRKEDYLNRDSILSSIPEYIRLFGPDGYGDGHLVGPWLSYLPEKDRKRGFGGSYFESYKYSPVYDERTSRIGDTVLPLYSTYMSNHEQEFSSKQLGMIQKRDPVSFLRIMRDQRRAPDLMREIKVGDESVKTPTFPGRGLCKIVKIYTFDQPSVMTVA